MQQGIAHTVVVHIVSDVVGGGLGLGGRIAHRLKDHVEQVGHRVGDVQRGDLTA